MAKRRRARRPAGKRSRPFSLPAPRPAQWLPLAGLAGVYGLSLAAPYVWLGALCAEVGFQCAAASALLALVWALRRSAAVAVGHAALAILFALPTYSHYLSARLTPEQGPLLRVAQLHLDDEPLPHAALSRWLAKAKPDLMSLTGVRPRDAAARFPGYETLAQRRASRSALLLWRDALEVAPRRAPGPPSYRLRMGRCQIHLRQVVLPPLHRYRARAERQARIARLSTLQAAPLALWLGHFGSRAQAADLAPLREAHKLRDVRHGHGRLATAPASLGPLGFATDHILIHGWISARAAAVAPSPIPGSHRVLQATLELTERRCRRPWAGSARVQPHAGH